MKVSYQWLSEYVDLSGYTAADLAEKLTRSGIEVDGVESRSQGLEKIVIGYVKAKEKHPDADKLGVCTVDAGQGEDLQIVCGAPNVDAGQKVPVALVGAKLPGGMKIKKAKLRGVESRGMICSAKELGMNDKLLPKSMQEGILVLSDDAEVGTDAAEWLGLNDEVLELDLTPNRSDCLSMIGTAYEIAAILKREVKLPSADSNRFESKEQTREHVQVKIEARDTCSHYSARYIQGVKITDSPQWMQNRLMAAGVRPINTVVDITNYVMLEYGQPLHAFDAEHMNHGEIVVRHAQEQEQMVTLDDVQRTLEPHMLLVTNGKEPVAIAGVMGGADSEVSARTTQIILESARFDGGSVRITSRQLGLRSESSLRFEKEVDPSAVVPALNRAAALMAELAGGQATQGIIEEIVSLPEPVSIEISVNKVNEYLGTHLSAAEVQEIFERLEFSSEAVEEGFKVDVPTRRGDIERDVDLIEEIARLYGYDNIPTTLMSGVTTPGSLTLSQQVRRSLRRLLTGSGLNEVINYTFTDTQRIDSFRGHYSDAEPVRLAMPMSEERSVLRTSLIPHLLDIALYNQNRTQTDTGIFEIGKVFVTDEKQLNRQPQEKLLLSMLWTGYREDAHWQGKQETVDFYDLKGIFEKVTDYLGVRDVQYCAASPDGFHPGRTAEIWVVSDSGPVYLGVVGQLHPELQQEKDLRDTYVLEVELDTLGQFVQVDIDYKELPRYPSVGRDMALVVDGEVEVDGMMRSAQQAAGEWLESIEVFDVFADARLGENKKSIAFALVYRHPDRTLTDEEVSERHQTVVSELEQTFQAELRK